MQGVVTAILGGGRGSRLWPLTQGRAKPAVPLGGKFRLIDIPISNSLHGGVAQIYVLTQYASASLHRHIAHTYRFDHFGRGSVDILAAEQSAESPDWYQGTADAVRQNLNYLTAMRPDQVLILSGDQLYLMDVRRFVRRHRDMRAEFSIAVTPVSREEAPGLGILRVDPDGWVVEFVEKPQDPGVLDDLALDAESLERLGFRARPGSLLASMGIYIFDTDVLTDLLAGPGFDFGREIIPGVIKARRALAYPYNGYWTDIGTIPSFHSASIALTRPLPPLNLYDPRRPIYTNPRFLPGAKINRCAVEQSILCEGTILSDSTIRHSIVGIRAIVREGAVLENTVLMGAPYYEVNAQKGQVPLGIGRNCEIRNAIIDLGARIGDDVRLVNAEGVQDAEGPNWVIRGGIIVVPREASIEPGTVI